MDSVPENVNPRRSRTIADRAKFAAKGSKPVLIPRTTCSTAVSVATFALRTAQTTVITADAPVVATPRMLPAERVTGVARRDVKIFSKIRKIVASVGIVAKGLNVSTVAACAQTTNPAQQAKNVAKMAVET